MDTVTQTVAEIAGFLFLSGATWLWHKARGEKRQSVRDMLTAMVEHAVLEFANNGVTYQAAEREFEERIEKWSKARGYHVPHWVTHELTAWGMQRLAEEYKERVSPLTVERLLKTIAAASSATASKFEPPSPGERTVPPIEADITELK